MRILHVSTRLILGGSQENTVLSCEGQARRGHEVHLAFGPIYGPEGSMLPRIERFNESLAPSPYPLIPSSPHQLTPSPHHRIHTHLIPHLVRDLNPIADFRAYHELRRLIAELKPDVVHTHSSKAGILGRAAAWAEGGLTGNIKVVHTIHGPPFHKYEKWWRNRLYIMLERFAAKRCHAIVSVADAMTRQFLEAGIGRPDQFVTVHSGMEVDQFLDAESDESSRKARVVGGGSTRAATRAALGLISTDTVIGAVARLAELKGHDDILNALGDDLRANPNLKLLWVGDGWWTERLTSRLEREGLRHKVILTGLVPPERIPELIRAMDLVVHASYREGLPRVVPQALLCAVPVVAYDTDGTGEACIDAAADPARGTGRLVPPGNIPALREAIHWMLADPARARAAALRGQARCRERFSAERMVDALEQVYAR